MIRAMLFYLKYVVSHRGQEGIYTHLCDNNSALLLERRQEWFENTWVALCSLLLHTVSPCHYSGTYRFAPF